MDINQRVENYAIFLKNKYNEKELLDLFGIISADEEIMDDWNLSEEEYFSAIDLAYFQPASNFPRIH